MGSFESCKREAAQLERLLEDKVSRYQQLTQKYSGADALSRAEQGLQQDVTAHAQDIQMLFTQLSDLVAKKLGPTAVTPSQRAVLTRFQQVVTDLRADFDRSTATLQRARERYELLGASSTFGNNSATGSSSSSQHSRDAATESLLRERNHIHSSMTAAATVIGQAEAVRSDLHGQGRSLRNTGGVMGQIASNVPGLNTVIEQIRRRRSRDDKIVATVVASCIVFTLWYMLG